MVRYFYSDVVLDHRDVVQGHQDLALGHQDVFHDCKDLVLDLLGEEDPVVPKEKFPHVLEEREGHDLEMTVTEVCCEMIERRGVDPKISKYSIKHFQGDLRRLFVYVSLSQRCIPSVYNYCK